MFDRAKEALRAETANLKEIAYDVAISGAYLYPFKGIIHLSTRPALYKPLLSRLLKTLSLGISITTTLFIFTYIPQATLMALFSGPIIAPFSAALLVLSEASAITHFISRSFLLRDALLDTFDAVLLARGHEELVTRGREVKRGGVLGKMLKRPFSGLGGGGVWGAVRGLLLLPVNFVPVVGTAVYVYVSGKKVGPGLHERYFQLKGFSEKEREEWVRRRRGGYTGIGMASVVLEMVPFVSMVFEFTNAVGAALWAADLEKANK